MVRLKEYCIGCFIILVRCLYVSIFLVKIRGANWFKYVIGMEISDCIWCKISLRN